MFVIGSRLSYIIFVPLVNFGNKEDLTIVNKNPLPIIFLLLFVCAINIILIINTISSIGIDALISLTEGSGSGSYLRMQVNEVIANGRFGWVLPFSMAILLWSYWNIFNKDYDFKKNGLVILFILTCLIYLVSSMLTLTRGPIFNFVITIGSILFLIKSKQNELNISFVLKTIPTRIVILFGVFYIIQAIRTGMENTNENHSSIIDTLMGYFPASYNRLAAILSGVLVMPNSNTAYYTSQFLWDFPFLSRILGLYQIGRDIGLNLPTSAFSNWLEQFWAVEFAGLNSMYIWPTTFGFVYSDFGWYSVLWFAFYGVLCGFTYVQFLKRNIFGIIIYPYVVLSIVEWWGTVVIASRDILIYLFAVIFVFIVKIIFSRKKNASV
ncbi:hypothetical protein GS8_679 [Geobacillus stearothermophilus]|uniref:Oligosaccharide repeat unit polymerase n=1 Tax=Geobacillus stearothermophilus TaxID=1422 RepID=A0ABQ7HJL3_GEOSE|nr:hypothetical protein GS8_679 [Geobacillus stearothermophilus]